MAAINEPITGESKKRVCYFFDSDIGNYHYGPGHPMKPTRIRMCHSLVMNYGLYKQMEIFRAKPATKREMSQFHTDEYVDFLHRITPDNENQFAREQVKYNVGDDCPIFDGLFEYCSISAGGSMEGAARLSRDKCDIAVNWAGGLHHAKKAEATGFCYVNDIVLGILELLRYHQRVLYVDIDVHHGDGVEEAFYTTDRVMTCSFHKYGEFFPGTGEVRDNGIGKGKGYACNVPLRDGMSDENYKTIFEPVIRKIIEWYQPGAIVLQCGADSLSGDRLGSFNLSMRGHAACVQFIKSFNLPLLMLGGGGYTVKSVSRTWAYETGLAAGVQLGGAIPNNEYYEYYGPDYELDVKPSNMTDHNTREYLDKLQETVFEMLRDKTAAPSVQIHTVPKLAHDDEDDNEMEDAEDRDVRRPMRLWDKEKQNENSLSDSEDEGTGGRRHRQSHREGSNGSRSKRRRSQSPRTGSAAPSASVPAAEATPATTVPAPIAPAEEGGAPADNGSSSKGPVDIQSWAENVVKSEPAATPAEAAVAADGDVEMADASAADVANGEVSGAGAGDVVAEGA
ncbi:Histone deacetylase RPD3 [Vanrija pseudolonga]|uniref:histone deacetylase n=1 Tax=Vanrija pseudolonga TaxID=143232 RepID=A0AAF1BMK4_9TREE|nr:Histone deacetylase RPD3 [Vanrija pseudolonga]